MRRLATLVAVVACLALALPAAAQDDDTQPELRLIVSGLTTVLGPGTLPGEPTADQREQAERVSLRVLVENTGTIAVDDLRLSLEVFEAIGFRSTLRTALDFDEPRRRLRQLASDFVDIRDGDPLQPGDIAGVSFASTASDLGIVRSRSAGVVFPIRLSVVEGIDPLDQVTTSVIYLRDTVDVPLTTVVGWPLDDEPWRRPGGVYLPGVDAPVAPGGRLDRLLQAVEQRPDLPVTLLPAAHLMEDLADRADGFARDDGEGAPAAVAPEEPAAMRSSAFLQRLRARIASGPVPPVAAAYADANIAGLVRAPAPLDDEAATAVSRGRVRLDAMAERTPDVSTYWASTALDRASLDVLAGGGATDRVLLPFDQLGYSGELDDFAGDAPGPLLRLTSPSGREMLALVPDPYVDRTLREPDERHGPIVAAQRVLAETAVLWTELPLDPRPLVILPPLDWDPYGRFAPTLVRAIADAPWLRLQAPAALDELAVGRNETARLAANDGPFDPSFLDALLVTRRELAAVQEAVPGDDGTIAGRAVAELDLQLLRAPSAWFDPRGLGAALIDDVGAAVDEAYGTVNVAEGARITLTSDTGQIPVTIQRREGGPLQVVITIEETRANLDWPDGREKRVTLRGTGAQTYSFAVAARSTGSFAVDVRVTDPAGVRELAVGTITIRSTAISGPALAGTAVVVLLLLLLGSARRRPRRPALEVVG